MTTYSLLIGLDQVGTWAAVLVVLVGASLFIAHLIRRHPMLATPVLVAVSAVVLGVAMRLLFAPELIADERAWHVRGVEAAELLASGQLGAVGSFGKDGYPYLVGAVYIVVGQAPLVIALLNAPIHGALVFLTGRTAALMSKEALSEDLSASAVRIAAWVTALSPSFLFWAPRLLRETLCVLLIVAVVYGLARYVETRRVGYLVAVAAPALALVAVRTTVGLGVVLAAVAGLTLMRSADGRYRAFRVLVMSPLVIGLAAAAWAFLDAAIGISLEETAQVNASNRVNAASGYEIEGRQGGAGTQVLLNTSRAVAGPFPFEWSAEPVMLLAMQEGLIWLILVACAALALRTMRRADVSMSVALIAVVVAAALVLMFGYRVSNYGLLARMRPMGHGVLIPLAAVYLAQVLPRRGSPSGDKDEQISRTRDRSVEFTQRDGQRI